jgi:glycosyltransferase involved in cell wall biosynthesis/GT2 family glycosyltransferase
MTRRAHTTARSGTGRVPSVCFVTGDIVGPIRNGGIGTSYYALARALARAGHDVTILYAYGSYSEQEPVEHWVEVYAGYGIRFVPVPPADGPELRGSHAVKAAYNVYRWLEDKDFDVVHFHEWRGIGFYSLLARSQGRCLQRSFVCVGVHSPSLWHKEGMHEPVAGVDDIEIDFMERESVARADVAWFPSRHMQAWVTAHGWAVPRRRFVRQYVIADEREPRVDRSTRPVHELCFFGRLETRKGLDVFCDALDVLSARGTTPEKVTLLGKVATVGGVDSRQYLERRSAAWPIPLEIVDRLDRDAALRYLSGEGRLAVLPSRVDNLPLTVLECLWAGIPFVTSDAGGIPEMVAAADRARTLSPLRGDRLADLLGQALRQGARPAAFATAPRATERTWVRWHEQHAGRAARVAGLERTPRRVPLVSVCLIHRNRPAMLRQAIDSIRRQTYSNLEIVLVDDGSDQPEAIDMLTRLEREFRRRRFTLIRQPRRFPAAARNAAARAARGTYLLFMDDDNVAKPAEVATLVSASEHSGADVLTCFLDVFQAAAPPAEDREARFRWSFVGGSTAVGAFRNAFGDTNCLVKRRVYRALGGMTEDTTVGAEDWEFLARATLDGYRVEVLPEALVWYRQSPNGVNSTTPPAANHLRALRPYRRALGDGLVSTIQLCARPGREAGPARQPLAVDHVRDVVIFGAAQGGQRAVELAARCGWHVAYMVDNNQAAWNTTAHGVSVRAPQALEARDFDLVVIASVAGRQALSTQLDGMGLSYGASYAYFLDTFSIGRVQVSLSL